MVLFQPEGIEGIELSGISWDSTEYSYGRFHAHYGVTKGCHTDCGVLLGMCTMISMP